MYEAGSSRLEKLMWQWESSQVADKSPQWEQPVLFPKLPFIPRARKYPQIPLASPFLSHKSPFPPLKSSQNALPEFWSFTERCFLLMKVTPGASLFLQILPEDPPVMTAGAQGRFVGPSSPRSGSPMASPHALCLF